MIPRFAICLATSRIEAEPEPLSLIPGPGSTESRWAPTTTVSLGSPALLSAITLADGVSTIDASTAMWTVTGPAPKSVCSSSPTANDVPITGIVICGGSSVPASASSRPG